VPFVSLSATLEKSILFVCGATQLLSTQWVALQHRLHELHGMSLLQESEQIARAPHVAGFMQNTVSRGTCRCCRLRRRVCEQCRRRLCA